MAAPEALIDFPEKLRGLFQTFRYKVMYGGRGGSKSWNTARALLSMGANKPIRVLCAREVQVSIKDSVHRLLSDQIELMGLGGFYTVLENEIRGLNGTAFFFKGLLGQTVDSLKSYEGVDICWVEEAHSVSDRSWQVLTPTIRKPGSEIWITFNPHLDTDPVWKRFVEVRAPESWVQEVNWRDNPWFTRELELERQHCLVADPESYDNIWEGKLRATVEGAIYAAEIERATREERITRIPYDPRLKVHTVWDLGWNDSMVIGMFQRIRAELRVIDYVEDDHKTLDWYAAELAKRNYNWGYDFLPHDGGTEDYKTGTSAKKILASFGRRVRVVPGMGVEDGIKAARMVLGATVFDKGKCARLVDCLKRYRRQVNQKTGEDMGPVHDEFSHGADMYRYAAIVANQMTNEEREIPKHQPYVMAVKGVM